MLPSILSSVLLSYSNQYASRSSTDFFQPHSFMYLANSIFISAFPTRHNWNSFLKNGSIFSIGIPNLSEKRWLKYRSLRMIIPSVSKITAFIIRIKKFPSPKIEYQLVAERSEANQNTLTFPFWCARQELNLQSFGPQPNALSIEPRAHVYFNYKL